jgi:hypothetical protein
MNGDKQGAIRLTRREAIKIGLGTLLGTAVATGTRVAGAAEMKDRLTRLTLLVCLAAGMPSVFAEAGGVRGLSLPSCVPLREALTIDGRLDDWSGIEKANYVPMLPFGGADLRDARNDIGVAVRTAYDAKGLYVSGEWLSPKPPANSTGFANPEGWQNGGDGMELHLSTGREVVHILSYPSEDGKSVCLFARRNEDKSWIDLTQMGGAAAVTRSPSGFGQELFIPWSTINPLTKAPSKGKLDLAFDFAWRELGGTETSKLDAGLRAACIHTSSNVLTSRNKLFGTGHLPNPNDWGTLVLAGQPRQPRIVSTAMGKGPTTMTAVETATPPAIDGKLGNDEWPAEQFAEAAYLPGFVGDRFSCSLATKFDKDNLYIAGRFSSPKPPFNTALEREQNGFKGGDCLQIRMSHRNKIANLCAWMQTDGTAALTADGRELQQPFLLRDGAKLVYGSEPGKYTMEMAIPWAKVFPGLPAPKTGESLKLTFQPWWLGADARFTVVSRLDLETRGALSVEYALPRDAEASLGVYDRQGHLKRWLARADFRNKGDNVEFWDGRDQYGNPLPAGQYTLKGLFTIQSRPSTWRAWAIPARRRGRRPTAKATG